MCSATLVGFGVIHNWRSSYLTRFLHIGQKPLPSPLIQPICNIWSIKSRFSPPCLLQRQYRDMTLIMLDSRYAQVFDTSAIPCLSHNLLVLCRAFNQYSLRDFKHLQSDMMKELNECSAICMHLTAVSYSFGWWTSTDFAPLRQDETFYV